MAVAGSVNLLFKANTKLAVKGLKTLGATSKKTSASMLMLGRVTASSGAKMTKGIAALAGSVASLSVAAGAAGTAIGALAVSSASSARKTQNWADSLGVAVGRLDAMKMVAAKNGLSGDLLADSMKDLSVKIRDAAGGAQGYEDALNGVGLKSKDLLKLSTEDQFLAFADAVKKADAHTRRFTLDEINDSMFQLSPLMAQGGAAIKAMTDEAAKADTALTSLDRGSLLALDTSFKGMTGTLGQLKDKLSSELAPAFQRIFDWMAKNAMKVAGVFLGIGKTIFNVFKGISITLFETTRSILSFIGQDFKSFFAGFDKYVATPIMTTLTMLKKVGSTGDASILLDPKKWQRTQQEVQSGGVNFSDVGGKLDRLSGGEIFAKMESTMAKLAGTTIEAVKEAKRVDVAQETGGSVVAKLAKAPAAAKAASSSAGSSTGQARAEQINPNKIRLGGGGGGSMASQQLIAQKITANATKQVVDVVTSMRDILQTRGSLGMTMGTGVT